MIIGAVDMSQVGRTLRLGRIFYRKTGRTVIVSMDHGLFLGPIKGLERPVDVARKAIEGGANAILTSPGICQHIVPEISGCAGLILRIDGATTTYGPDFYDTRIIVSVEDAVRMNADAVIVMGYIGAEKESKTLENIGSVARECEKLGMPLFAEMMPVKSERIADPYDVAVVSLAARVGAELGADIIKTYYTGSEETFKEVVRRCPVPIVVAGGPKMESEGQALRVVREAINVGAAGVVFGRNIWQHGNPGGMTRAIGRMVHEGISVEEALKEIARNKRL